jgi:hypothetical protein
MVFMTLCCIVCRPIECLVLADRHNGKYCGKGNVPQEIPFSEYPTHLKEAHEVDWKWLFPSPETEFRGGKDTNTFIKTDSVHSGTLDLRIGGIMDNILLRV